MGHDISAYIKTKADPNPEKEIAYFRINAFNTTRQRLFYGTLNGSERANGGVSGVGLNIEFSRQDIVNAINACKYYLDDDTDAQDFVDSTQFDGEKTSNEFKEMIRQMLGGQTEEVQVNYKTEIRENIADIWKFHEDILSEYDDLKKKDDSAQIQIYFC